MENSKMYHELKVRLMEILMHEDHEVNLQAAAIMQSLDEESVVDFMQTLFSEVSLLIRRVESLNNELMKARRNVDAVRGRQKLSTRVGRSYDQIEWND